MAEDSPFVFPTPTADFAQSEVCCPCTGFWEIITAVAAALTAIGMIGNLFINLAQALKLEGRYRRKIRVEETMAAAMESQPAFHAASPPLVGIPPLGVAPPGTVSPLIATTNAVPSVVEKHIVIERSEHEAFVRDLVEAMHDSRLARLEREVVGAETWRHTYGQKIDELMSWRGNHSHGITPGSEHAAGTGFELRRRDVRTN
ncbi:hypothetical protein GQ53DRAFT_815809 [Thozetella sp. PMI_491]|nr:hypothetical protein GQ53DRAFT_815809 [Thozetella sp. PMI_491]